MTSRLQTGLILLILSILEFTFRSPVLWGNVALFQRDLMLVYFPLVQSILRELSNGAFPLRDPTSAFGQPLLADPSCQILYPPAWVHLLLPPALGYGWLVSVHSVFGALGVALLARRISGGSFVAGLIGGCAWLASGPLQSLATLWHHMAGAAWIPWVLLAVERVLARSQGPVGLLLGAAVGAQILAGSADMCAMTLLLAGLRIVIAREWSLWKVWLMSGALALTLSAGVWLPAAEMVLNSGRSSISESARTYWSLNPLSIFEFFLPVPISAFPLLPVWREGFFEGREPFLGSMFFGVSILPLGLAAIADSSLSRTIRATGFLGAVGAVLAALGKHGPFYSWLVSAIPLLKILRYPSKAVIPAAILICVFAGVGAASVRRSPRSRQAALVGIAALSCAALTLMGPLMDRVLTAFLDRSQSAGMVQVYNNLPTDLLTSIGLLALLGAYLLARSPRWSWVFLALLGAGHLRQGQSLHNSLNSVIPSPALAYRPEYLDLMRPPREGRLYVYDYGAFRGRAARYLREDPFGRWQRLENLEPATASLVTARAYLTPLTGAFWNVEYAWDSDLRMLFDRRLADLTIGIRQVEAGPGFLKLLQISGVQRVVALHEAGMGDLRLLAQKDFHPGPLRIFGVPEALPRAFLVGGRVRGTGRDLRDLLDPDFDPRRSVLVDRDPSRASRGGFEGAAQILDERSDRIQVETRSNGPAFLGLIEGAMPGWRAWVDGQPVTVERANAIFIGTEVPAGTHQVEFRFLPTSAIVGVILTSLTGLFLLYSFARRVTTPDGAAEGMLEGIRTPIESPRR